MNATRPTRARAATRRLQDRRARLRGAHWLRSSWLRVFALLVLVLGLVAQQRVLTSVVRPSTSVARLVAERVQSIETHAVRAQPALRVAPAPLLARLPAFPEPFFAWPRVRLQTDSAAPHVAPTCASISHFHGQRRIPRMNSEEPPRA